MAMQNNKKNRNNNSNIRLHINYISSNNIRITHYTKNSYSHNRYRYISI